MIRVSPELQIKFNSLINLTPIVLGENRIEEIHIRSSVFFVLFAHTLLALTIMPGFDYRALNAVVAKAPANRLKMLLASVKRKASISLRSKEIQKLPRACNRKLRLNDGFKLAMVQMRFGSLNDTTVER